MKSLLAGLFLLLSMHLQAQSWKSVGIHLGVPIINEKLTEGRHYKPFQLLFYYNFANLLKRKNSDLFVYLEPQLVWVHFKPKDKQAWEIGANLGLEFRYRLGNATALSAAIGSGPHYITVKTNQQARGFIFSDNFTAGFHRQLGNSGLNLDVKCRFRHVSNANLKQPNKGIDSWFLIAGVSKVL